MRGARQSGFSLIEMIMVMIIVAVASVPILGQFTQLASGTLVNESIQVAAQLAQERAEEVLALRRRDGYSAVSLGMSIETMTGGLDGFSRTLTVADVSGTGECPVGTSCKRVLVGVEHGLKSRAQIVFLILDY